MGTEYNHPLPDQDPPCLMKTVKQDSQRPTIVWFRDDLRLEDHPALLAACAQGAPVIPVFLWSPGEEDWPPGAAGRWWLHQSLTSLSNELARSGSRLIVRRGPSLEAFQSLVAETRASAVFWNRCFEPASVKRDAAVETALAGQGIETRSFPGDLLHEPPEVKTQSGGPYQVFTPFWNACRQLPPAQPHPAPAGIAAPGRWPESIPLQELELEPAIDWADGLRKTWKPGFAGAGEALAEFLADAVSHYPEHRDRPDLRGSSRLSAHLHFGEVSVRKVWHAAQEAAKKRGGKTQPAAASFLRQLGWRDFARHLLFHFPHTVDQPLRSEFERFPWKADSRLLRAWQRGKTGYPIVDAGMRELWTTGWMHNRARMIAASFLVKDLLIPWQQGAEWFWDTLVDADLANNTLGWQWTAGCGADAAPFFRIFNPVLQGKKFDPQGGYVRRWVPEIAGLSDRWIHEPWKAPAAILKEAGVKLGRTYPTPIVDHDEARRQALAAYRGIK
jgi:deoxyribodipyrimidine photo-lyase